MSGPSILRHHLGKGIGVGVMLWALVELIGGAAAAAHIDTDPAEVTAGQPVTVLFTVQHGCGESPTTELAFAVPAGVRDMRGVTKHGWQIANAADAVTFGGGELEAHTVDQFGLTFTATAAGPLPFPMIQTCRNGELAWISVTAPGQQEPDYPAPMVQVLAGSAPSTSAATPTSTGANSPTTDHTHAEDSDHDEAIGAGQPTGSSRVEPLLPDKESSGLSTTFTTLAVIGALVAAGVVTVVVGVRIAQKTS